MHLYVELWKVRPAWLALPVEDRQSYFAQLGVAIQQLAASGVEIVGFALNDAETPHRADYRYLAVWKMQDLEQVEQLERAVEQAGWHQYFEQVNARGPLLTPEQALADMARLGR